MIAKHSKSLLVLATALVAGVALAACPGGKGMPGKPKIPGSDKLDGVPGVGPDAALDPNGCGGYSTSDAGRKLKAFLEATAAVEKASIETVAIVKNSCIIIGNEIGMTEADYKGETKDICAAVYGRIDKNLNGVAVKSKAALKIKFKPAVCTVDAKVAASAAASCEGKASADIKAKCSGNCQGTCSGKNTSGKCDGVCEGKCDGYADVDASAQCKANAEVKAAVDVQCSEPELTIDLDAKLVVDKKLAEQTVKGLKAGLPKIFMVRSRLVPLKHAVEGWVKSAAELKSSALSLANNFKDQAKCVTGQIYAAAKMTAGIQANISVSVEVSASASGSVGQ
ncbi:MAG: hypothetical protein H0V17_27675 [Deltaproteobacteria bacterium]|nr:hypothetical protein [Deltaproteobacteria bacterium]